MTTLLLLALILGSPVADGKTVVRDSIEAMGGEARLRGVHTLSIEALGHVYAIDQSERPEGPWVTDYEQHRELLDLDGGRLRRTIESRSTYQPAWSAATAIIAEGVVANVNGADLAPGRPAELEDAAIALALGPARVLLTALDASDLTSDPDETAQGITQRVVRFTWKQMRVRLLINAHTRLLTSIEVVRDDPRGIWGDITERTWLTYWMLESNGLMFPRQWNREWNGTPIAELSITAFTPNPSVPAEAFTIPPAVREAFAKVPRANYRDMKLGSGPAQDLAEGVVFMPGSWNVTLVKQADGLVVIEAPISSNYSVQVLDEAARRFPGVRVKAVLTTSDAWPHMSGLREYVARGIPVYGLDLNKPIIDRLLASTYRAVPDKLAGAPARIQFHPISDKTVLGDGPNRIVIYPIYGENGERMLMAHLPDRRLLYSSDDIIKMRDGSYFMPGMLVEVTDAVARNGVSGIDTAFGMHLKPTPWTEILGTLQRLRAGR
jgi:hypothetical protein